jgi:hypothetical protein
LILDKGICSVYAITNIAEPGNMPKAKLALKFQSWYGELNFETTPVNAAMQENVYTSARIRILQNRNIDSLNVVTLSDGTQQYDVTRAYHGVDDESGEIITDLTLKKAATTYEIG